MSLEPIQVEFLWPTRGLMEILDYNGFTFFIVFLEFSRVQKSLAERRDAAYGFEIRVRSDKFVNRPSAGRCGFGFRGDELRNRTSCGGIEMGRGSLVGRQAVIEQPAG